MMELPSPSETLIGDPFVKAIAAPSTLRKCVLLGIFCLAQFLDACSNSMLFPAIPTLTAAFNMAENESVWIISGFQLTFASFLLISGRISDIYSPKIAFITGVASLCILSVGAGFVQSKILIIVIRAFCGMAASLTIPSALTLLVRVFPDPTEQARAIGVFGGCGSIGNVLGLNLGAIIIQFASWPWIFWTVAIVAAFIALACLVVIPPEYSERGGNKSQASRFKSLDMIGVSILTVALVLFIFAITSGSASGWNSALVLAPLFISVCLIGGFLYWETLLPVDKAAVPPRTWFYPNFTVLFGVALLPFFWWTTSFVIFSTQWQDVFHWSVISTSIHMIPIGVLALIMSFTGSLSRIFSSKWIILTGHGLLIIGTILLAFASTPDRYWTFVLPAFITGSAGAMLTFTHTNIAIFRTSPSSMAGTVGAIFNGALQLGGAIGIAAVSSIEASIERKHNGGFYQYQGRAAAFWFVLAVVCVEAVSIVVFYKDPGQNVEHRRDMPSEGSRNDEKTVEPSI